jgi:hypothetical protein
VALAEPAEPLALAVAPLLELAETVLPLVAVSELPALSLPSSSEAQLDAAPSDRPRSSAPAARPLARSVRRRLAQCGQRTSSSLM